MSDADLLEWCKTNAEAARLDAARMSSTYAPIKEKQAETYERIAATLAKLERMREALEKSQKESGVVARQLFLLWSDLQGRIGTDKLRIIEALAKRMNDAALTRSQGNG